MSRWLALLLTVPAAAFAQADLVDGIAAQVGGEIVLISDVRQVSAPAEARLLQEGANEADIAILRAEVLERLIERALIRQVVERAELGASEVEVDAAIAAIASDNDLSLEQLRDSVEAQGLAFDTYRERIRGEIEQAKVVNGMVGSRVRVEEREVRELYEKRFGDQPTGGDEVHLRHLLVPFDPEDAASRVKACAEVEQALARIRTGTPFEEVASQVSDVNPERGGDIGWLHVETLAGWMRDVIDTLEPGQSSGLLETTFGCNLLQLVERRAYQPIPYEKAREPLRAQLFDERMAEEYAKFMETLREKTYIERKGIFAEAARLDATTPDAAPQKGSGAF